MSPKDKARLLGILLWAFTAFNIIVVAVIGVLYTAIIGAIFSQAPHKANEPPPELFVGIIAAIFIFLLAFTVLFSIPKMVAGYGLRKEKSWAKVWAIIACIMCCLSFPFGTAIGVFGLIFLFGDDGKRYFEDPSYGQLAGPGSMNPQAPPPNSWQ